MPAQAVAHVEVSVTDTEAFSRLVAFLDWCGEHSAENGDSELEESVADCRRELGELVASGDHLPTESEVKK